MTLRRWLRSGQNSVPWPTIPSTTGRSQVMPQYYSVEIKRKVPDNVTVSEFTGWSKVMPQYSNMPNISINPNRHKARGRSRGFPSPFCPPPPPPVQISSRGKKRCPNYQLQLTSKGMVKILEVMKNMQYLKMFWTYIKRNSENNTQYAYLYIYMFRKSLHTEEKYIILQMHQCTRNPLIKS